MKIIKKMSKKTLAFTAIALVAFVFASMVTPGTASAEEIRADSAIKVTSPNGGEVWKAGTKNNIVFKGKSIKEKVNISLEWNGGGLPIGESVTSGNSKTSTYSWTIPKTLEERNDYRVRVEYKTSQDGGDLSDKTFTITSAWPKSSKSISKSSSSSATSTARTITLKVEKNGEGTITSDDGKINCGTDCKEVYSFGSSAVSLTATPTEGFTFDKWTGNICFESNSSRSVSKSTGIATGYCQVSFGGKSQVITTKAHFKKISSSSSSSRSFSSKSSSSSRSSKSSSSKSSISSSTSSSQQTPSITITYPQAGYTLYNGLIKEDGTLNTKPIATIQWNEQNGDYPVDIYLLNQTGNQIKVIAQKAPDTGSYIWAYDPTLPNGAHQYQIRISTEYSRNKGGSTSAYSGHFIISNKIMY